mmetsp:Transcript_34728/g.48348  ORF Transcript_34728/g.48348 Transcript_34728/m.48348 type:complete len:95 (-) Transcript_34728:405-689(-)
MDKSNIMDMMDALRDAIAILKNKIDGTSSITLPMQTTDGLTPIDSLGINKMNQKRKHMPAALPRRVSKRSNKNVPPPPSTTAGRLSYLQLFAML